MNFAYQDRQPPAKLAAKASIAISNAINAPSGSSQTSWISDIGATDHFTPDITHLLHCHEYKGNDHVIMGNQTLPTTHTGSSQLYAYFHMLKLHHILRVSFMSSNILTMHKFCKIYNASLGKLY